MPKPVRDMVAEAKARIENLSVEQVATEIGEGAVLVDIRESEELVQHGMLPGAIHVPRGLLEFQADPESPMHRAELDPGKRIILHCAAGGRSALAAVALQELGYENVAHLESGFSGWVEAGRPIETP